MAHVSDLISQYPILQVLSEYLSTLDLFHLALTDRSHYDYILSSKNIFNTLRRSCLCDGHGLADRQNFVGLYSLDRRSYNWGLARRVIWQDDPIEVRLYGTKCDDSEALPCIKCGINICEECRYYRREPPHASYPVRRPHLNSPWQHENVMCLCPDCDVKLETELKGKHTNELCDCDVFTRWICSKCVKQESKYTYEYYGNHTTDSEVEDKRGETKTMPDHAFEIQLYCWCDAPVPDDTRPRCTWCKRRHLPEEEWRDEWDEIGSKMPMFDEDPCYPPYIGDIYKFRSEVVYPPLKYTGPIWQVPEKGE